MKKIRLHNLTAYGTAQILLTLGIILAVKSNYGISVATSPAYVLSCRIHGLTFGTLSYLYQGITFILTLIIIREIKLRYFLSFLSAVITGYLIDLWTFLLRGFVPDTPFYRIIILIFSLFIMSLAIATFIVSNMPLLPFDIFVRKISDKFGYRFSRVKLIFDLSNLTIAVVLSLLFFGQLVGVYWGTLVFGLSLGPCIGFFMSQYDRFTVIESRLPSFLIEENKG